MDFYITNKINTTHILKVKYYILNKLFDYKLLFIAISLALITTYILTLQTSSIEKDLQDNIIRLHIRGKSNSDIDQNFKLYIRDMVLYHINSLNENSSYAETNNYINNNQQKLEQFVDNLIKDAGYSYKSTITFGLEEFPPKHYGFITLPTGTYQSLTINLDEGDGDNWWCVVYPPLCYVESDNLSFDDTSMETLKNILDEKTFNSILSKNENINMKFKLLEVFDK